MPKRVLLITDMAGQTKVAMTAMIPILSHMGYSLFNLPTALVSLLNKFFSIFQLPNRETKSQGYQGTL